MRKKISRRDFAKVMSIATATSTVAPLGLLNSRFARADGCHPTSFSVPGFGPVSPSLPQNASLLKDIPGVGDLSAVPLIAVPPGFNYTAISIRGQLMSDGNLVPGDHDGMAAFKGKGGNMILVRNHELDIIENKAGSNAGALAANGKQYDRFQGAAGGLGGGGTSTVVVSRDGAVVQDYVSLGGTIRNCAGGPTPWASWISCEEDVTMPGALATRKHGYNFEVPAQLGEAVDPIPLTAMGRMNHEAVSVDPTTGAIYETEDRGDSAYYRYVPRKKPKRFGDLQRNDGELYAMVIKPDQKSDCDGSPLPTAVVSGARVVDTRGNARNGGIGSMRPFLGQALDVDWVRLEDVDPDGDTLRFEAQSKGAALWWRGEGAWEHKGKHYWVTSGAGDAGEGQVWRYDPKKESVMLLVESTNENLLDGPDNITVGLDGTLYLCEDGTGGWFGQPRHGQRVVGLDADGGLFTMVLNVIDTSEFAGACFSHDGRYLFVNAQGIGITFVIWRADGRRIELRFSGGFGTQA